MKWLSVLVFVFLLLAPPIASPAYSDDANPRVQELQQALKELGYTPGPADGILGPATKEAIKAFQRDHDMEVDGKFSGLLLFSVNVQKDLARQRATPEGRAREKEKQRLLALSNSELTEIIEGANKEEAKRIVELIGERIKELPVGVLFKVTGLGKSALAFMTTFQLERLFYPDSEEGIRQFQQDLGAEPTGELTMGQFEVLNIRATRVNDTKVYALGGFGEEINVYRGSNFVSAEGTWIIEGEEVAYPINTSKIECWRQSKECLLIQAQVIVPSLESSDDSYNIALDSDIYSIVSWSKDEILARDSGNCRSTLLTINLASKEVFEVTSNNRTKECEASHLSMPAMDKPRISRLVPSFRRTYDWWQQRTKKTRKFFNQRARKDLEAKFKGVIKGAGE